MLYDCYNNNFSICTILDLFQFFSNQVLSLSLQAYCSRIPSLKFELPITYNYVYSLSTQFILYQTKLIKSKLKWMFMQNIT